MKAMKVKCPTCHTETVWEGNPYRPFCSERCKLIDLGKWAGGEFRIEGEEPAEATDGAKGSNGGKSGG